MTLGYASPLSAGYGRKRGQRLMANTVDSLKAGLEIVVATGGAIGVVVSVKKVADKWIESREKRNAFWETADKLATMPALLEETNHKMTQMLEQVSKQQSLLEFVARHTPAVIWLADDKGIAYWFNEAWEDLFGISSGDAMELGWQQAIHPDDREATWRTWSDAVSRGTKWSGNYRIINRNGVTRCVASATPVRSGGTVIGYVGTTKPIERKGETTKEPSPVSSSERGGAQD